MGRRGDSDEKTKERRTPKDMKDPAEEGVKRKNGADTPTRKGEAEEGEP